MTELENKILGTDNTAKSALQKQYLTSEVIWKVAKTGCGSSLYSGRMVAEMLSAESKKKALKGCKKISENGFTFERLSKEKVK